MNQISLYNKSTDSKLSIEAEELTRSRNLKIPKDGSFLLTNKTRLTEELADKYTVGPTGDFQELEEAVRVLCNMKEYSSRQRDVIVELQENYRFESYSQFGMNAGFIVVRPKTPMRVIDVSADNLNSGIFVVAHGSISPRFEQFNMHITSISSRLFDVVHHSSLIFDSCIFTIGYQDKQGELLGFPLFLHYDDTSLVIRNTVISMSINRGNNTMLNNGKPLYRWLSVCGENSNTLFSNVKITIEDKSNINESSVTSVFPTGLQSRVLFTGRESLISYLPDHGSFVLISTHSNGCLTLGGGLTLTGNSILGNQNCTLIEARNFGSITCDNIKLKDCGADSDGIGYSFKVFTGSKINIANCQSINSHIRNETNITVNTLTRNGVIYK